MKRTVLQIIALIGFAVCTASYAQAQSTEVYRAEIPFEFSVGKKAYPAGSYRIEVLGATQKYFVLKDSSGRNSYIANSTSVGDGQGTRLDFHRVGGSYYLASINSSGRTSHLPKAVFDHQLARSSTPEKVTIVMSGARDSKTGR